MAKNSPRSKGSRIEGISEEDLTRVNDVLRQIGGPSWPCQSDLAPL